MNPLAVAAVWAGAGVAGAAILPAARVRRLAVLVPFAGLAALVVALVAPAATAPFSGSPGVLHLDRTTQGLLMASAISLVLTLVLAPTVEGPEALTIGLVGAAAVIALTATSPVVWSLALLGAAGVIALRWIAVVPGRVTLASGRIAVAGAAVLLAAAPFLPVADVGTAPRPVLVSALLACGLAALLGLLPVGGWALGGMRTLRSVEAAVWPLLVAPAALLSAQRILPTLPLIGQTTFGHIILGMGLGTAVWSGFQALRAAPAGRYPRVLIADVGLAAATIGSGHPGLAQTGGLFLMATHLLLAPLLLQPAQASTTRQRTLAWLLLSGIPPAPSFWGRLILLEALAQVSPVTLVFTLAALGMLSIAAVLGARRTGELGPAGQRPARTGQAAAVAAWLIVIGGIALGALSQGGATFIFGGA